MSFLGIVLVTQHLRHSGSASRPQALALLLALANVVSGQARPASCEVRPLWSIAGAVRSANIGSIGSFETDETEGSTTRSFPMPQTNPIVTISLAYLFDYRHRPEPAPYRIALATAVADQEKQEIFASAEASEAGTAYRKGWNLSVTKNVQFAGRTYRFRLNCRDGAKSSFKKPVAATSVKRPGRLDSDDAHPGSTLSRAAPAGVALLRAPRPDRQTRARSHERVRAMIGQTISHFRITEKLGAGGMGVVYKAFDTRLDRPVALKFLPDHLTRDAQALERFRREARAASALNHPNICTIYDIGEQDGRAFIAMEFIEGETLRNYIYGKALPLEQTLKLGMQIAEALDAAHAQGIIHRDIKPANIFVTKRGQSKVLDFGLAKLVPKGIGKPDSDPEAEAADSSIAGVISGTPAYMSPEQVRGDSLDARTDIFSLGLLLYEMSTGRQAFGAATPGMIIEAVLTRTPVPPRSINPEIPLRLEQIINKALHKQRQERYQQAADLRDDLQHLGLGPDSVPAGKAAGEQTQSGPDVRTRESESAASSLASATTRRTAEIRAQRVAKKSIDSLAVLPFENLSRDPEHEYFGDGIAGSLINVLATVPKLRVMAQSTVFRYKGRSIDPQAVGTELNVRAVLTGRIMPSGGSLRIGAELVDVATGSRLWGAQYDRASGDIFAIQDEIAKEISEKLRLKLTRADRKRLTKRQTDDPEAYRLYLKGRHHWNRWTEDGFYKAIEYFEQASARDPAYALAHSGVADSYVLLGWNSYLPPKDAFPKAKAAAERALWGDPDLGEAHAPLAAVLWLNDWRWPEAKMEFERSIALNSAYPTSNHWHAEFLMTLGRHEEAIARMKRSQELDPLSLIISVAIGWAYYMARRQEDSMEQLRRTVELDPNYPVTYWILGLLQRSMGRFREAIAHGEKGVALSGGSPVMRAALAQTLAVAGEPGRAREIQVELEELSRQKYVSPYFLAGIHVGLGQPDRAMEYLEQAYRERSHWLLYLHIDPAMDALRPLPGFADLLRRVGLPL